MVAAHALPLNSASIRVMIVDDHPVTRFGIAAMLTRMQRFVVVGEAEDGVAAVRWAARLRPDIVLLDLAMPQLSGLEAMRMILQDTPEIKVVLLTALINDQQVAEALQLGARGIVLKNAAASELTAALRVVSAGKYWIGGKGVASPQVSLKQIAETASSPLKRNTFGITRRELQLVECIVQGCSNKDVAKQFGISVETVKRHLTNIFNKTGVSTRTDLAMFAIAHKIVVPDDLPIR